MVGTREQIYTALFAVVSGAYPWMTTSRRVKLWGDVPGVFMPALYQGENAPDTYRYGSGTVQASQQRIIHARLFCYIDTSDPTTIGATQLNNILDALDGVLEPVGADGLTGKNSLGGLVDSCRIASVPLRDPGDIDTTGMLIVNIEMVLP